MADFTTLAHEWRVRVNDGFHRAEYIVQNVASEAEAFAVAAKRWRAGEAKEPHGGDPAQVGVTMPVDIARQSHNPTEVDPADGPDYTNTPALPGSSSISTTSGVGEPYSSGLGSSSGTTTSGGEVMSGGSTESSSAAAQ